MNSYDVSLRKSVELITLFSERESISADEAFDIFSQSEVYTYIKSITAATDLTPSAEFLQSIRNLAKEHAAAESSQIFARNAFLTKLNGKQELVLRLLQRFTEGHADACIQITGHIASRDFLQARSVLHDIIGVSGNLCCQKLYEASVQLRLDCIAETGDSLPAFQVTWSQTMDVIRTYLLLHQPQEKTTAVKEPFSKKWNHFYALCKDCDISAADYFEEHRAAFREAFDGTTFQKLESSVRQYDFFYIAENIQYEEHQFA